MIDWGIIIGVAGALTGIGGLLVALIRAMRQGKNEVDQNKLALNKYIDDRVEKEFKELTDRVEVLEGKLETALNENRNIKNIVRHWFARLVRWDSLGRSGSLPVPEHDEMRALELA